MKELKNILLEAINSYFDHPDPDVRKALAASHHTPLEDKVKQAAVETDSKVLSTFAYHIDDKNHPMVKSLIANKKALKIANVIHHLNHYKVFEPTLDKYKEETSSRTLSIRDRGWENALRNLNKDDMTQLVSHTLQKTSEPLLTALADNSGSILKKHPHLFNEIDKKLANHGSNEVLKTYSNSLMRNVPYLHLKSNLTRDPTPFRGHSYNPVLLNHIHSAHELGQLRDFNDVISTHFKNDSHISYQTNDPIYIHHNIYSDQSKINQRIEDFKQYPLINGGGRILKHAINDPKGFDENLFDELVTHHYHEVRQGAAGAIAVYNGNKDISHLHNMVAHDPHVEVRRTYVNNLAAAGKLESAPTSLRDDPDDYIKGVMKRVPDRSGYK